MAAARALRKTSVSEPCGTAYEKLLLASRYSSYSGASTPCAHAPYAHGSPYSNAKICRGLATEDR